MNRLHSLALAMCLTAGQLFAQGQARPKEVDALLKRAEKVEHEGSAQFVHAETLYETALELAPEDAEVNLRMGLCQLNGPNRHKALPYFEKAASLDPLRPRLQFLLGYALQLSARWDEAIAAFQKHKAQNPYQDPDPLYNTSDDHIQQCRNGKAYMARAAKVRIMHLGEGINSAQADYGAALSADGSELIFTSRRPSADAKVNKVTGDYFEDVYSTRRNGDGWGMAERLPAPVNTPGNDASIGLFDNGRTMLMYRDHQGTGDLFRAERNAGAWNEPVRLSANVNTEHHESSACYSPDRKWLYFVSARPDDNVGGQDIYRAPWDEAANDWGPAENLGPVVNSIHDEEGVFVHPDGKTIYFSSKGHVGMGGYDIYKSTYEGGRWSKPENLGWPINSPDDDLFFMLTADGAHGYFSSFRADGLGEDDLYEVDLQPADAEGTEAAPQNLVQQPAR
ncbi:MAG: PD40 domain-containing protein [Flavobacteriales bacterium]|nr:PD40 domain-containing protein [Flavobacteriales bacterium]